MALDFETEVFLRLKKLGLKRKDLAKLLGVSPAVVSKLLAEDSSMTLKTMAKVAVALNCEVAPIRLKDIGEVSYADSDGEGESDSAFAFKERLSKKDNLLIRLTRRSQATRRLLEARVLRPLPKRFCRCLLGGSRHEREKLAFAC